MSIPATQMRPGMVIKHENNLCSVFSVEHRFRSPDPIERVMVDEEKMEFLFSDGDFYTFMNTENYEQMQLGRDILGDAVEYLTANLQITIEFFDGKPVGIELPQTVELKVMETEPGMRSATASAVTKPAKLETGLTVQVPAFINEGDVIRVDTSEGAYLSRA